jgi:hypothetical protein
LVATAAIEALAVGTAYMATATQVIAFMTGPVGIVIGIGITGGGALISYQVKKYQ